MREGWRRLNWLARDEEGLGLLGGVGIGGEDS